MRPADEPAFSRLWQMPGWLVAQVSIYSHRLLTERLARENMRPYHYRLLGSLDESGPASQAMLGRRTGIDRSDVVTTLDDLVDRGLVTRAPDPDDGRRNIITITPAGRSQARRLHRIVGEVQDELVEPLSPSERATLVRLLTRVLEHHRR